VTSDIPFRSRSFFSSIAIVARNREPTLLPSGGRLRATITDHDFLRSSQLNLQLPAQGKRGTLHGEERDRSVVRVEKSVERRPTRVHHACKSALGDVAFVHLLLNLVREDPLDSACLGLSQKTFLSYESSLNDGPSESALKRPVKHRPRWRHIENTAIGSGWGRGLLGKFTQLLFPKALHDRQ